jgi:hypothetical protein
MHINQVHCLIATATARQVKGLIALSVGFALIGPGITSMVLAQAPGPELFAKEPRTSLELWDAVDYLLRTNQAKKALPYLEIHQEQA